MPHVDELLGITTLASMGLLVAVSLQPVGGAAGANRSAEEPVPATTRVIVTGASDASQALSSTMPAATAKDRT